MCAGNTDQAVDGQDEVDEDGLSDISAPLSLSVDVSSASDTSLSSPSSACSSPSAYKRKRIDVDGIANVIREAVVAQSRSTEALLDTVASQAKGFEVLAQSVVQNGEMIRMMAQLLASREAAMGRV